LCNADVPENTYLTDYLTDQAIEQVRDNDSRPFFLNLWYYAVHTPIQAKPEKIRKYEAKARAMGLDRMGAFEEGECFPSEHKKHFRVQRRVIQSDPVYAAMIESLDENIGRLLDALQESGKADDTVIVFTSDNGGLATSEGSPTCNAPLAEGKGWMYEGGTREPLIVKCPGVTRPGSVCDVPVTSPDFYPTLLDLAELPPKPEQHVDGVNLVPLLKGDSSLERDSIFWHYPHYGNQGGTPGASVRSGDYKLIEFFEDNRLELYDLRNDASEARNLAADHPDVAQRLKARLDEWKEDVQAQIPQRNPEYAGTKGEATSCTG